MCSSDLLVALDTLLNHKYRDRIASTATFYFIEKNAARCRHLAALVASRRPVLPPGWIVRVVEGSFDESLTQLLNVVEEQRTQLAPAFVMVDPFGVSGTPMSVIERILKNKRSEVYVSFMYEAINRFKSTPEFAPHLDDLFGCRDWREGTALDSSGDRRAFFFDLYERQLRAAGARQVVHFELYEGDRLVYAVFFGSHRWYGADAMKSAVWKVAPFGDFAFRGTRSRQLKLGLGTADFRPLQEALRERFQEGGWVDVRSIEQFVGSDKTDYHTGQLKSGALKPMEQSGALEVEPSSRKRRLTFPAGTRVRFL